MIEHQTTTSVVEHKREAAPRRVRICTEANKVVEFTREENDLQEAWLPNNYGTKCKDRCARLGRAWERQGYDAYLNNTYAKPDRDTSAQLRAFVMLGDDCIPRGLERYISTKHANERRQLKVQNIETVVDLNIYMKRNNKSQEETEEELCSLSTEHSQVARAFARRIALADERAVHEERLLEEKAAAAAAAEAEALAAQEEKAAKAPKKSASYSAMKSTMKFTKRFSSASKRVGATTK